MTLSRAFLLLAMTMTGCGGDDEDSNDLQPPTNCQPGIFSYVHNLKIGDTVSGQGAGGLANHAFVNATSSNGTGTFSASDGFGDAISIEFSGTLANGASGDARGSVVLTGPGINVGNCETGGFSSTFTVGSDGETYSFILRDVRAAPYCSGDSVEGQIAGCYRTSP